MFRGTEAWLAHVLRLQGRSLVGGERSFIDGPSHVLRTYRFGTLPWIPNVITFIVMLGVGSKHVSAPRMVAPTPASVLSFGTTVAASVLS